MNIDPVRDKYIKDLREALEWLVNIGHGKSRDGKSDPKPGEFEKSMRHAEEMLTRPEDGSLMNAKEFWERTASFWKERTLEYPDDNFIKTSLARAEKRLDEAEKKDG